jgi:hypothetical protein
MVQGLLWQVWHTLNISSSVGVTHITKAGPPIHRTAPLLSVSTESRLPRDGVGLTL